eukprot:9380547-Lingulodinium_polyedra.AAC.1
MLLGCNLGAGLRAALVLHGNCLRAVWVLLWCCLGAIREPLRRQTVDSTASLCAVFETMRNDA